MSSTDVHPTGSLGIERAGEPGRAPLTGAAATLDARLDALSDYISPIVVKELRQYMRSREFVFAFSISLVFALAIAFYGSAQALSGSTTAGRSTFTTLVTGLTLLGCVGLPIAAFGTLRAERLEQTLDLISLTALSPRRIVLGKLMVHGAKLTTFFAAVAPFVATSFLLGGVDFVTIGVTLASVFLLAIWVAAAALCFSATFASRMLSGFVFGALGLLAFVLFSVGRVLLFAPFGPAVAFFGTRASASAGWVALGGAALCLLVTLSNLVLLTENRLALASERRVTSLRIGLFVQFLFFVGWAFFPPFGSVATSPSAALDWLVATAGLHMAVVAFFAVTEGPPEDRRARAGEGGAWRWLFGDGSAAAALYMLLQMIIFFVAGVLLGADRSDLLMLLAVCGAISLFTGLPTLLVHRVAPAPTGMLAARGAVLVLMFLSLVVPDLLYYVAWRPDEFSLAFSQRHLLSPIRTVLNWGTVVGFGWMSLPMAWSFGGIASYLVLVLAMGARREPEAPLALARGDTQA